MTSHVPNHARSPTLQVNIKNLIDDIQCYKTVREFRWPKGIMCPCCESTYIIKRGFDDNQLAPNRYVFNIGKYLSRLRLLHQVLATKKWFVAKLGATRCRIAFR